MGPILKRPTVAHGVPARRQALHTAIMLFAEPRTTLTASALSRHTLQERVATSRSRVPKKSGTVRAQAWFV